MHRRTLILGAGGAALAWPMATRAQRRSNIYRVGVLGISNSFSMPDYEGFREQLRALGYVEGQNIVFEVRMAEGHPERLPALAEELLRAAPDVIVAPSAPAATAVQRLTQTIPIVFFSSDPVVSGLAASLARPGGNATGFSLLNVELAGKRVELLKDVLPGLTRVAVLWAAPEASPAIGTLRAILRDTEAGARVLGIALDLVEISEAREFESAFARIVDQGQRALIVLPTPVINPNVRRVTELAIKARLAAIGDNKQFAAAGGLLSYGANYGDLLRRAAIFVDKILKGAKPADLPVEQPTKFELAINLKTAKALGLTLPQSIFARADEVIE
jgi:ABC-type uncharacterized transport system substrate-binding protein